MAEGTIGQSTAADVSCGSCDAPNDPDARFCEECGGALAPATCRGCDGEVNPRARFCKHCGEPTASSPTPAGHGVAVRKTVTILFADLAGSTAFEEQVDAESARSAMARYHGLLQHAADELHAGVVKFIGDGFMAVWGVPEIGEDDAARAVQAGATIQERFSSFAADVLARHDVELALRVSINTGEVVVGDADADLVGDALNVAARLEKECPAGSVVVGEPTYRSTRDRYSYRDIGIARLRGREAPIAVYELEASLVGPDDADDDVPFVGREGERRRLVDLCHATVEDRSIRLATVIGLPGVGKTRLAREVGRDIDATYLEISCSADANDALGPVGDAIRVLAGAGAGTPVVVDALVPETSADRGRIVAVLDNLAAGGTRHTVEETFWAVRRLVELTASRRPLLVVVDDIHWADPVLLDLLEHLVEWVRDAPTIILALARPEIREARRSFAEIGRHVTEVVALVGLTSAATTELASEMLGSGTVPPELVERLPTSTEGNPLFVRELVRMLVDDGVLARSGDAWELTVDVDALDVPPSIHALLATRLERLPSIDRRVLEVASIIGNEFTVGAITDLLGDRAESTTSVLDRLRRLQLAEPAGAYLGDDPLWRFHHVLIRDVAYRRLLKTHRASLHEEHARWIDARVGGVDRDETVARHLDAARRYRLDLDLRDNHTDALGREAASRYLHAAGRALDRDELTVAGVLAGLGVHLDVDDPQLDAALARLACEARLSANDVAGAEPMLDRFAAVAGPSDLPWVACYRAQLAVLTDPHALVEAEAGLTDVIEEFARLADRAGSAKAHLVRAGARARLGRIAETEDDLDAALAAAREAGASRLVTLVLGSAPAAALWGPSPVPRAGGRCLDVTHLQRITTAAPSVEATSVRCQAVLEALGGRPDIARTMLARARRTVAELGLRHGLMETELFTGIVEMLAGEEARAESCFRTALDGLRELGVSVDAALAAALLARSLLAQGRLAEADEQASTSEGLAGHDLKAGIAWRTVRAEIHSALHRHSEARSLAEEAVGLASPTDLVVDHADALAAMARILAADGDLAASERAQQEADAHYRAKGVASVLDDATSVARDAPTPLPGRIQTPATMAFDAIARSFRAHDVDEYLSRFSSDAERIDRRNTSGTDGMDLRGGEESMLELAADVEHRAVASRGEHLVLGWLRFTAQTAEFEMWILLELDPDDLIDAIVIFDVEAFGIAMHELDDRCHAGDEDGESTNGREWADAMLAYNALDWALFRTCFAPGFVLTNRTGMLWGSSGVDSMIEINREVSAGAIAHRAWAPWIEWFGPDLAFASFVRLIVEPDGSSREWHWLHVMRFSEGKLASMDCWESGHEPEAAAFARSLIGGEPRVAGPSLAGRPSDQH